MFPRLLTDPAIAETSSVCGSVQLASTHNRRAVQRVGKALLKRSSRGSAAPATTQCLNSAPRVTTFLVAASRHERPSPAFAARASR
jgi:hypothetical protein